MIIVYISRLTSLCRLHRLVDLSDPDRLVDAVLVPGLEPKDVVARSQRHTPNHSFIFISE